MLKIRTYPLPDGGVGQEVSGTVENDADRRLMTTVFGTAVYHDAYSDQPFWETVRVEDCFRGDDHPALFVSAPPGTMTLSWNVRVQA